MAKKYILLFSLLLLVGGIWRLRASVFPPSPEKVVARMMDTLQGGKVKRAEKYTVNGLGLNTGSRRARKFYKEMYATMRYLVADTVVDGNQAQVTLSVTMVDMDALLVSSSQELLGRNLDSGLWGEGRFYRKLAERIRSGEESTATYTAVVSLVRTDGRWRVDAAQGTGFLTAITGGIGPF